MFSQESKSRAMENFRRFPIIPRAWVEKQIFQNFRPNLPACPTKKTGGNLTKTNPFPPPARVAVANKKGRFFFVANEWREKLRFHPLEVMISSSDEVWQAPTTSDHALGFLSGFILGVHPKTNMEPKNWVVLNVFPISKGAFSGSILILGGVHNKGNTWKSKHQNFCDVNQLKQCAFGNQQKNEVCQTKETTFTFRWRFLHWTHFCHELHSLKVSPWKWAETQLESSLPTIKFQVRTVGSQGGMYCFFWQPFLAEQDGTSRKKSDFATYCNNLNFLLTFQVWPSQVSGAVWRIAFQCGAAKGW